MGTIPPKKCFLGSIIDEETPTAEFLRDRGDELFYEGCYKEAIFHYQESLKLEPNQSRVLHGYGVSLYHLGHSLEALEKLNLAASLSSNPQILFDRALVFSALERFDKVLEDLNKLLEESPWNMEIVKYIEEVKLKTNHSPAYF